MEAALTTLLIVGTMAAVVVGFRALVRRPARVSQSDPPGVRTMVVFAGNDSRFFRDDRDDEPYVGIRLFQTLCDGLSSGAIGIQNRGAIQNAQRAECVVDDKRFALVLEWIQSRWVASVEWVPASRAEKRHLALTQQVFAPTDSRELRQVLVALDDWLKTEPNIWDVKWYRKEQWIAEDASDPRQQPIE